MAPDISPMLLVLVLIEDKMLDASIKFHLNVRAFFPILPERGSMVEVGVLLRMLNLLVQPWLLKDRWMEGLVV